MDASFDPQAPPPAASALVGPSYPREPRFSETLRSRWNLAVTRAFDGVRTTDWAAASGALVDSSAGLIKKLGNEAEKVEHKVEHKLSDLGERIKHTGEQVVDRVEAAKEARDAGVPNAGLGVVGGDVRADTYTGGAAPIVKAKRESEKATGRLV